MANSDNNSLLNLPRTKLSELLALHEETPWSEDVIVNDRNRVRVIYNMPGESLFDLINPDNDEIWIVLFGQVSWRIGDEGVTNARPGDIIFVPAGTKYSIRTTGRDPSVRVSINAPDAPEPPEVGTAPINPDAERIPGDPRYPGA
ncbi:MAG: cupin domain-containing protein [Chloroflexi bacterium]|jgi:mannose-6-phosphate isomerase-like protein (cupin superfamily)|nr:cupin domain-containing protein [Chloroflexota bacterium]MBT4072537.1 cupin domain-containing protein [Chloroflexota bacterium]MBT4514656.1 cupin domain-containing protein [Chloroflexota bacterium]MBT5320366.1 cupin domain-containing protein [Chloroflexota bacterium]MBT6682180.1 cupin domain-containing protein [Chloroflexota bacterium]